MIQKVRGRALPDTHKPCSLGIFHFYFFHAVGSTPLFALSHILMASAFVSLAVVGLLIWPVLGGWGVEAFVGIIYFAFLLKFGVFGDAMVSDVKLPILISYLVK